MRTGDYVQVIQIPTDMLPMFPSTAFAHQICRAEIAQIIKPVQPTFLQSILGLWWSLDFESPIVINRCKYYQLDLPEIVLRLVQDIPKEEWPLVLSQAGIQTIQVFKQISRSNEHNACGRNR